MKAGHSKKSLNILPIRSLSIFRSSGNIDLEISSDEYCQDLISPMSRWILGRFAVTCLSLWFHLLPRPYHEPIWIQTEEKGQWRAQDIIKSAFHGTYISSGPRWCVSKSVPTSQIARISQGNGRRIESAIDLHDWRIKWQNQRLLKEPLKPRVDFKSVTGSRIICTKIHRDRQV